MGVDIQAGGSLDNGSDLGKMYNPVGIVKGNQAAVIATAGTIYNYATLVGVGSGTGVLLNQGASLYNLGPKALIEGYTGVKTSDPSANIFNRGTVLGQSGVGPRIIVHDAGVLLDGGLLYNGTLLDESALIQGPTGVTVMDAGAVTNYGVIGGINDYLSYGVDFTAGGRLTNGAAADPTALIEGEYGVEIIGARGTVTNFGTILETTLLSYGGAVMAYSGDLIINGDLDDPDALIKGVNGVVLRNAYGSVINYGTVRAATGVAISSTTGAMVINGGATDTAALLEGDKGVYSVSGPLAVTNFGTIRGSGASAAGIFSAGGGTILNGGGADRSALIQGAHGVVMNGPGTVRNFGAISALGGAGHWGVRMPGGGTLTNGSVTNHTAVIEGYDGVAINGSATNFGTIVALGDGGGVGVEIYGGLLTNGSAAHRGAVIEGYTGVDAQAAFTATVINFGTIVGDGGTAIQLSSSSDVLAVETGSAFVGAIYGGGGTLDLASGTGTIAGLLNSGDVLVSGVTAATTFQNFGAVEVGLGASFALSGAGAISAGQGLVVAGTLSAAGTIASAGTVTLSGTLAGTGVLNLTGGTAAFSAGTALTIAKVTVTGASVIKGSGNLVYGGVWSQSAGTLSVASGAKVTFTGTDDNFAGTLTGAGSLAFSGGSDALGGLTLSAKSQSISTSTVTLSGAIKLGTNLSVTTPNLIIAASGATISGPGELILSNTASNGMVGAIAAATLTDNGRILGAGSLGGGAMTLVIGAGGSIDGDDSVALTIDTGSNTIANAGIIYATGAGGTIVKSAVANTGKLYADGGVLTLDGAISGVGRGYIDGGTLFAASTFTENVTFNGASGALELANSQAYAGTITGFSTTGATSLDLLDINFLSGTTKATYSGTSTSGTLTVTDGTHTARIKLAGNYTASTFTVSAATGGGTQVVDPTAPKQGHLIDPAALHQFITAMAGIGAGGGLVGAPSIAWNPNSNALAAPISRIA